MLLSFLTLLGLDFLDACIPTQQVVTTTPAPCTTCPQIYSESDYWVFHENAPLADVTISTTSVPIAGASPCVTYTMALTCPATHSTGLYLVSSAYQDFYAFPYTATCSEYGSQAGQWISVATNDILSMVTCVN